MGETIFVTIMAIIAIGVGIAAWWGESHGGEESDTKKEKVESKKEK